MQWLKNKVGYLFLIRLEKINKNIYKLLIFLFPMNNCNENILKQLCDKFKEDLKNKNFEKERVIDPRIFRVLDIEWDENQPQNLRLAL